ncbi:MAG: proton-conducting transporter membrane subunit, partial [Bacteroidota bacterium]
MSSFLFLAVPLLCFLVFLVPDRFKNYFSLVFSFACTCLFVWISMPMLTGLVSEVTIDLLEGPFTLTIHIDYLSFFFFLVTTFTIFTASIYSGKYMEPYREKYSPAMFSLHYFSFMWLYLSMIMVLFLQESLPFLICWELMGVSSFILVIFEAGIRTTLKSGVSYLIQMHIGFFILLAAFLVSDTQTSAGGFAGLAEYFGSHANTGLFLLFFIGFGLKAGFIPLHTWLPDAHPAAPSHISAVMSGVMIKMGIYGIFRVLTFVTSDLMTIGVIVLIVSVISGLFGVMMAIVQHDLKKLLAYHSIENIGIIGIGMGIGTIGLAMENNTLVLLGFAGALLHVLNHSLFKSLLFFSAGSVYKAYHTRDIGMLGGVIRKMPYTAMFFAIGSIAICGLPPLNGFISEYLIFNGLFKGMADGSFLQVVVFLFAILGLVLIGGLAIYCFTKAFGMVFLGEPRTHFDHPIKEQGLSMLIPQVFITAAILVIGLWPGLILKPISMAVISVFPAAEGSYSFIPGNMQSISLISGIFILLTLLLILAGYLQGRKHKISRGPTWGCGYTAPSPRQ